MYSTIKFSGYRSQLSGVAKLISQFTCLQFQNSLHSVPGSLIHGSESQPQDFRCLSSLDLRHWGSLVLPAFLGQFVKDCIWQLTPVHLLLDGLRHGCVSQREASDKQAFVPCPWGCESFHVCFGQVTHIDIAREHGAGNFLVAAIPQTVEDVGREVDALRDWFLDRLNGRAEDQRWQEDCNSEGWLLSFDKLPNRQLAFLLGTAVRVEGMVGSPGIILGQAVPRLVG